MIPRFTTNARPGDYRSGIEPMDDGRAAQWRKDRWLVPLIIGLFIAGTLAVVAVSPKSHPIERSAK